MLEGAEILLDPPMARRGRAMLDAMAAAAPAGTAVTSNYQGRHRLLMLYGAGQANRMAALQQHRARGGRVVVWDLGYWAREEAMRLAIDSLHPSAAQLALAPAAGQRFHVPLQALANPAGPILLVGLGDKSAALYGLSPMQWERQALARIRQAHPGRPVLWRPKGRRVVPLAGTMLCHGMPIEAALAGCSLVVCRHSNVAVDACAAGVPVQCEDGAALALYGAGPAPAAADRAEFLRRLGWWCWRPGEAGQAWEWIRKVTDR